MSDGKMTFARVQAYLDAIANNANLSVDNAPHGPFWRVSYQQFVQGVVPGVKCDGQNIPLIDSGAPLQSAFRVILAGDFCNKGQMPDGGPFVTDAGYSVTLDDGTQVTGQQILADIDSWLGNGFPEN
jgi:hypothetical protein